MSSRTTTSGGAADPLLRFSFRYLDLAHPRFSVAGRDRRYLQALLSRLKDLSLVRTSEFRTRRLSSFRIHPINFSDPGVSVSGFGLPPWVEADDKGWQFSLAANEHGRVHGFLVLDTFYIRWLDPEHNLYPGN